MSAELLTEAPQRGRLTVMALTYTSVDGNPYETVIDGWFRLFGPQGGGVLMRHIGGRDWFFGYNKDQVVKFVPYVRPVKPVKGGKP